MASTELADADGSVPLSLGSIVRGGGYTIGCTGVTTGRQNCSMTGDYGRDTDSLRCLSLDTGTTTGVITGRLMTFLDAIDLAKTETSDLLSLESLMPESLIGGMIEEAGP